MFGEAKITVPLTATLRESSRRLRWLAGQLAHGRVGWTGSGLGYSLYPSGQRSLDGSAENDQVSFLVELRPPGFYAEAGLDWEVEAEVAVRCDAEVDCGMHTVESFERTGLESAAEAVAALDAATQWLVDRARAVRPADWRRRDPRRGHA